MGGVRGVRSGVAIDNVEDCVLEPKYGNGRFGFRIGGRSGDSLLALSLRCELDKLASACTNDNLFPSYRPRDFQKLRSLSFRIKEKTYGK